MVIWQLQSTEGDILAETEISENQETDKAVNVVKLIEDQNSYINSAKSGCMM